MIDTYTRYVVELWPTGTPNRYYSYQEIELEQPGEVLRLLEQAKNGGYRTCVKRRTVITEELTVIQVRVEFEQQK